MPDYQYRCRGCQHVFEVAHSVHANALVLCPVCEDKAMRLVKESPAIVAGRSIQASSVSADNGSNPVLEDANSHACGCALTRCFHSLTHSMDTANTSHKH